MCVHQCVAGVLVETSTHMHTVERQRAIPQGAPVDGHFLRVVGDWLCSTSCEHSRIEYGGHRWWQKREIALMLDMGVGKAPQSRHFPHPNLKH